MEKPRLYTVSKVPDCDKLVPDTPYSLDSFPNIDAYIQDLVSHLFPDRNHISIEYKLNTTGIYSSDTTCITCLTDGGALFLTNIGEETKMYKEFDENCVAYVAAVKRANVICCPTNKCLVGLGMTDTLDIKISDGDKVLQINGEYTFCGVASKIVAVPIKLDFAFFNELLYHKKSLVAYDEIIAVNGLTQLAEPDTKDQEISVVMKQLSLTPSFHRFSQRLFLPNVLTETTCDWITKQMSDLRSENKLLPTVSKSVCDYLEFVIDNQLLGDFSRFYDIPMDAFAMDVLTIMRRDASGSNKRTAQFSMDIGLENGSHSFMDGTKQSFKKGDCIVYLNALRNMEEKVASKILTIEFNLRRKKMEMQRVF
jgi:hypothetical protein